MTKRKSNKKIPEITNKLLTYDPITGYLYRKISVKGRHKGSRAGTCVDARGYHTVRIQGTIYLVHRVAWYLYYKSQPPATIDHKNTDPSDNRINNLRDATMRQQSINTNGLGYSYRKRHNLFESRHTVNGRKIFIGLFECPLMARIAYLDKVKEFEPSFEIEFAPKTNIIGRPKDIHCSSKRINRSLGYRYDKGRRMMSHVKKDGKQFTVTSSCPLLARIAYIDLRKKHFPDQDIPSFVPDCKIKGFPILPQ